MTGTPIDQWWASHMPTVVSTNAKTATHLAGDTRDRAYCGHRKGTMTTQPSQVTCSACIAAATADAEARRTG